MKKTYIAGLIYAAITAFYAAAALIFVSEKNTLFWSGFLLTLFSCLLSAVFTLISMRKSNLAFPIKIFIPSFCAIYTAVSISINIIPSMILKAGTTVFTAIHAILLVLFTIIVSVIFIAENHISRQSEKEKLKAAEIQTMICEFEKIKNKLIGFENESQKKAVSLIDEVIEDLRFSNFSIYADVSEIDARILSMAEMLSSETDNLIEIQSDDITSFEANVKEIKKLIKDRNTQIKLSKSNI